ncbi:hypothetical protein MOF20_07135 [Bacillus haynesii]|uniref:hypothetical protein n=1 Tax=Bacillus haynesii TaxID=1925021 RepID=UPI00227DF677|nr:hypothetical protein [Bacillus haynesii]MCY9262987.1 hypothetical protein [Bacillus haynesii]
MKKSGSFGILLIISALIISMYFMLNTKALIPSGYDLAILGIVISRTLMIVFTFPAEF